MKPDTFPEVNVTYAKDQSEYQPLPAFRDPQGIVLTCWRLSWWDRLRLFATGRLWLMQLTFGDPLQPQCPLARKPDIEPAPATTEAAK